MVGQRLSRFWLYGGLLIGAVGCNRNAVQAPPEMPKPPQSSGGSSSISFKSLMGGSSGQTETHVAVGISAAASSTSTKKSGSGPQPDTLVAIADVQMAGAFTDPPALNRDELLDIARQNYKKALDKDPKNKGALLGMARLNARIGDKERSMEGFKKYLALYPKDHLVAYELAGVHARWKDFPGAVTWCEAALKLDPENRAYRKTLGICQALAGKWNEGFDSLCSVMPEPRARFVLARVMEDMNYTDQSRQQLSLALQSDPEFAAAREFLTELDQPTREAPPSGTADANPVMQAGYVPQN